LALHFDEPKLGHSICSLFTSSLACILHSGSEALLQDLLIFNFRLEGYLFLYLVRYEYDELDASRFSQHYSDLAFVYKNVIPIQLLKDDI